jgi:hypothetical protein
VSGVADPREESRPVDGPAELDVAVDVGRVRVQLDEGATRLLVRVHHDPAAGGPWGRRAEQVAAWIGEATAGPGAGSGAAPAADGPDGAEAVAAATVEWSVDGAGVTVRSSTDLRLRMVPLAVTVFAPSGSRLTARTGAGDVAVSGRAGRAAVRTGAGGATLDEVDGDVEVTTGSGDVAVAAAGGRARVRTGSGAVRLGSAAGPTDVKAGSGDVTLGAVTGDVGVRTGTGAVRLDDARSGRVELTTGSGALRVAVHAGVLAELDLSSGSGRARSELEVHRSTPPRGAALQVRGRTASGDVTVVRAP